MYKFELKRIEEIDGKLKFFKLFVNGECEYDTFCESCKENGNLLSELKTIQARIQQLSDLMTMPIEKHRDITPKNDLHKEYEIKTKHLRVYLFHDKDNGRIIVSAGKKITQPKDINHLRKLKKEYFKSKE